MKDKLMEYKERLEKDMLEYMEMPISDRSTGSIDSRACLWMNLCKMSGMMHDDSGSGEFTEDDARKWNAQMQNADGTTGGHWSVEQTSALAKSISVDFTHINAWCWNVVCNMMYSDYYKVACEYGVDIPSFYGAMAKAFLFDIDGPDPHNKVAAYYNYIAKEP